MASIRKRQRKDGSPYYEIRVSQGRGKPYLSRNWTPPSGWSEKSIQRELAKVAATFEQDCRAGLILSRAEQKTLAQQQAQTLSQIPTLKEYGERVFMPAKTVTIAENTRSSFQSCLDNNIYPCLGDLKLPDISPAQITDCLLQLQASGKAHATVIKNFTVLSLLFKMAFISEVIDRNPMDRVQRPRHRKDEVKPTASACTTTEVQQILSLMQDEPLKWRVYVSLLADSGLRRGEACGLTWPHVHFDSNTIEIVQTLCYTPEKGVYIDTTKNNQTRTIDVDPLVMELLANLKATSAAKEGFVFTQKDGVHPIHPQSPTRYMKKLSERNAIAHLHPHKLRHSFASIALTNGADLVSLADVLGHDRATTMKTYVHSNPESRRRTSAIVGNLLFSSIPRQETERTDTHD